MSGAFVFLAALGLLVATALSYVILGAAADARTVDAEKRRQWAVNAFASVLFSEDLEVLSKFPVNRTVERDTLVDVVSTLPAQLGSDGRERLKAVLETPRTTRTFGRLARSWRWKKRVDAARLCGLMGSFENRQRLLTDDHWTVRVVAVAALSGGQVADHADVVANMLLDPEPAVRVAAADALPLGGIDVTLPLNAILEQTSRDRESALLAAGRLTDRLLIGALVRHARCDHLENRMLAAMALARQSPIEVESVLLELLGDREPEVRAIAADSLGRIGSHNVFRPLRAMLGDESWLVRQAVERSLVAAGPAGGMLVRQNRVRRPELPVTNPAGSTVPLPVRRTERVRTS